MLTHPQRQYLGFKPALGEYVPACKNHEPALFPPSRPELNDKRKQEVQHKANHQLIALKASVMFQGNEAAASQTQRAWETEQLLKVICANLWEKLWLSSPSNGSHWQLFSTQSWLIPAAQPADTTSPAPLRWSNHTRVYRIHRGYITVFKMTEQQGRGGNLLRTNTHWPPKEHHLTDYRSREHLA